MGLTTFWTLPDAIIAASALLLGAELLTHDRTLKRVLILEAPTRAVEPGRGE